MKVLKFGAVWCSACLIMKPRWKEIEEEFDWLETEYFDADDNPDHIEKFQVKDIPCFIFLDSQDQEIKRMSGEIDKQELIVVILELKDR